MGFLGKRSHGFEIVSESHDLELGVGTRFVSVLADAGTTLVTRGLAATGRPEPSPRTPRARTAAVRPTSLAIPPAQSRKA